MSKHRQIKFAVGWARGGGGGWSVTSNKNKFKKSPNRFDTAVKVLVRLSEEEEEEGGRVLLLSARRLHVAAGPHPSPGAG